MDKYLGIDAGSRFIKYVLINRDHILEKGQFPSNSIEQDKLNFLAERVSGIGLTGYGRSMFPFEFGDKNINKLTEIGAAVKGIEFLDLKPGTIIDIGGQDTKVIKVSRNYCAKEFYMNDKCAAGTGKFIEMALNTLGIDLEYAYAMKMKNLNDIEINSTCAVFAETELIQLLYKGYDKNELFSSVLKSIARKIILPRKDLIRKDIIYIGGTASFNLLKEWLEKVSGESVIIPEDYRFINAIGAACSLLNSLV